MPTPGTPSDRMRTFKNKGKDSEELRRRRNEVSVELRKNKRDDALSKRRNVVADEEDEPVSPLQERTNKPIMNLDEIKEGIFCADPVRNFNATQSARKMLSRERNPPIDTMIQCGVIPRFVEFLKHHNQHELQFEAAWALTNIASGTQDQTRAVVDQGAVPYFVQLLSSEDDNVCEQAVWALGNIAGDGPGLRDEVIKHGIIKPLLALAESRTINEPFLSNVVWTISNLCRNKNPSPSIEVLRALLPALVNLTNGLIENWSAMTKDGKQILTDACWAMSYLTDGSNDRIHLVVDSGVIPKLVFLLGSGLLQVVTPALRTLGNIVTGTDDQTDAVVSSGALPILGELLTHSKMNIVKEAAWTISNITAGNEGQIQSVINHGILGPLLGVLVRGDFRSQKEAAWAVTNLTSGGSTEQLVALCAAGAIKPMCDLLGANDEKTVAVLLDGLQNILAAASKVGEAEKVCMAIEECEGLDKIEALQAHDNEDIYRKSLKIIDTFFNEADGEVTADGEEFKFAEPEGLPNGGNSGINF